MVGRRIFHPYKKGALPFEKVSMAIMATGTDMAMQHGGKRKGAGRPRGSVNKATADVRALAQKYTAEAIDALALIMGSAEESAAARVAAARELLDRACGKPPQAIQHAGEIRTGAIADLSGMSDAALTELELALSKTPSDF